ncbi:MAG: putative motility protein [Holophaga sp.]|nr:putative motility protein [Holophaga sp.]
MELSAISQGAASAVTQNYASLGSSILAAAQNPASTASLAGGQAPTQAQFSVGVLKKSLDIQATDGAELAAMINPASTVDVLA